MALIYNAIFDKNTRKLSFEDKAGNEIYSCTIPERTPTVDDITKPLTFKATQDGSTVKLTQSGNPSGSFQTSTDGGKNWVDYTIGTVLRLNTGREVSFRANSSRTSAQTERDYFYFEMTGKIEAWHNVMSLYFNNGFAATKYVSSYAFYSLFYGCTSLTKAPALPATGLAISSYSYMFFRCSLTKAPELPATTLTNHCYMSMFSGCQSLKEVRIAATKTASRSLEEWLYNVSSTGDFYCDPNATIFPSDSASGIPKGWNRIPTVDDITKPLTFKATQDGSTVLLKKNGSPTGAFQTSRDGGNTWTDYTIGSKITLNTGDEVSFRAKADRSAHTASGYFQFMMEGKIEAWHNVMSMIRTSDFSTHNTVVEYAFYRLFQYCTSLTKAPVFPATTLADSCYYDMFGGCESLTKAPALPATTLAKSCYDGMFYNCYSLTEAPVLPATTLADDCYGYMFSGCRSLNEVRCQMPSSYSSSQISGYAKNWLSSVLLTGTFYTNADANWPSGESGIPTLWTRLSIDDYPTTP